MNLRHLIIILGLFSKSTFAFMVQGYDVSKAWETAPVYVPSNFLVKRVDNVKVDSPLPVVIFLHGCGGINDHEKKWANFLKSQNYIVILPNSFGIPGRPTNCTDTLPDKTVWRVPVDLLRPAEAEFALSKVKELEWADKNNIFLMGFSEGGMAAQNVNADGFAGIVMSGFPCALRGPIKSAPDTPMLVLNWRLEPNFVRMDGSSYQQCSEKAFWKFRTKSTEVLLDGRGHFNVDEPIARNAVLNFLKENKK